MHRSSDWFRAPQSGWRAAPSGRQPALSVRQRLKRSRRRRCAVSVTKRNAGLAIRRSRQARRPADQPAAGIDAASMARRCQNPLKLRSHLPPANVVRQHAMRGTETRGTLRSEVSGGAGRRPAGDMSGEESPASPCPPPRAPRPAPRPAPTAHSHTQPKVHATAKTEKAAAPSDASGLQAGAETDQPMCWLAAVVTPSFSNSARSFSTSGLPVVSSFSP